MSFDFGKSNHITEDVNYLYQSIYEGNRVDQDADGDNDGADVMIARMIASGMSREEAIRKTRNKPYNKKGKKSEDETKEESLVYAILNHLIENGYADTPEQAAAMFENFSEDYQYAIIEHLQNF